MGGSEINEDFNWVTTTHGKQKLVITHTLVWKLNRFTDLVEKSRMNDHIIYMYQTLLINIIYIVVDESLDFTVAFS